MKKGTTGIGLMISLLPRIITTTILLGIVLYMLSLSAVKEFESASVEAAMIAQRLVYTQGGISHYDEITGRVYPLEIYLDEFRSKELKDTLNEIMKQGDVHEYAARIRIIDNQNKTVAETYYNEGKYKVWYPVGDARKTAKARRSKGDIQRFDFQFQAIVKQGSTVNPVSLEIHVYHPRGFKGAVTSG